MIVLTVLSSWTSYGQQPKDVVISDFPHFENFTAATPPDLPAGWSKVVHNPDLTNVRVETTTSQAPVSGSQHLRMTNDDYEDAVVMLISPQIEDLETLRISFWARANLISSLPDLVVGTMSDPFDEDTFTPFQTIVGGDDLTNSYNQFHVSMDSSIEDDAYLVFRHNGTPSGARDIYIDDILMMVEPDEPVLLVDPENVDFGHQEVAVSSEFQELTITNVGVGQLDVSPEDIFLGGADDGNFILENLESSIALEPFESEMVSVQFAPATSGAKEAVLHILDAEIALAGEGVDPLITEYPHFEDFDQVETPDLPLGWRGIVNNPGMSTATVETTTSGTPFSQPNHARLFSNNEEEQDVILVSPPLVDIQDLRIRFYAKCNSGTNIPDLIVGTMSDHDDPSTFTPFHTIEAETELTSSYDEEFVVSFDESIGDDEYIAFRHGGTPSWSRSIYIDDLTIEPIPTEPVLLVEPGNMEFTPTQTGVTSFPAEFIISNVGAGILVIDNEDIVITGSDADVFYLGEVDQTIELEAFESASVSVVFAPLQTGDKTATLEVLDFDVPLAGHAFDATITEFPHLEDFGQVDVPALPFGWTSIVDNPGMSAAAVETTSGNDPYSAPNHASLHSNNDDEADVMLMTPPIAMQDEMRVRFRAKVSHSTNTPELEVGIMSSPTDASTFMPVETFGEDELTQEYDSLFTVDFVVRSGFNAFIAFRHASSPSFNRTIYIDDVLIEEIPSDPVVAVIPDEQIDYGDVQIGTTSGEQTFLIYNDGGGVLSLDAQNINITGADAGDFVLNNLEQEVSLEFGETTQVSVAFAPDQVGSKTAQLEINDVVVPLIGEAKDATITDVPFLEDFAQADAPDFPFGWNTIVNNPGFSSALVEVTSSNSPLSEGLHARIYSNDEEEQDVMLVSPPVVDLDAMRVSFWVKCNRDTNVPDLIIGTMSDPGDENTFTPVSVISADDISTSYDEEFTVNFSSDIGDDTFFAFKHGASENFGRSLFLDDILLEEIPDTPLLAISPDNIEFEMQQTGTVSGFETITIQNDGGGTLTVEPEDISITGAQADAFLLVNIDEAVHLTVGQSTEISVAFAPVETGDKTASLNVLTESIVLTAEAYDATITEFPWHEGFEEDWTGNPEAPFGWTHINGGVGSYWEQSGNQSNTGDYSARTYSGSSSGYLADEWLITPPIRLDELDEALLKFYGYISSSPDGVKENLRVMILDQPYETLDELHENATLLDVKVLTRDWEEYAVSLADYSGTKHIAFHYFLTEEDDAGFNYLYIDDVMVEEAPPAYEVIFAVTDDSDDASPVEGAAVTVAELETVFTDEQGIALLNLTDGTYNVEVEKDGFETAQSDFTVEGEDVTIDITLVQNVFALSLLKEPEDAGTVTGEGDYLAGESVTVEATAHEDWLFVNWTDESGSELTSDNSYTFDMPWEDKMLIAHFEPGEHEVTLVVAEDSPQADPVENALVEIDGVTDHFITNENGEIITQLENGSYSGTVSKEGYHVESFSFVVESDDLTVDIFISDIIEEPFNLQVITEEIEQGEALFRWNTTEMQVLYEGFEEGSMPAGWEQEITNNNPSGAITATWSVNDHATEDYSPFGDYHAGLWWNPEHQDEWLISPEMEIHEGFELEFWTVVYQGSENEDHYYVKISDDGGNTWSELWDASEQTGEWNHYETPVVIDLDAYAGENIQIAFHAVDGPANTGLWYLWFIDEVSVGTPADRSRLALDTFSQVSNAGNQNPSGESTYQLARDGSAQTSSASNRQDRAFAGYNVFLNQQEVESNLQNTEFLFTDLEPGIYQAGVQAEYTTGTSDVIEIEFEVPEPEYTLTFVIENEEGQPVMNAVITLDGIEYDEGEYVFEGLHANTYIYSVNKDGYFESTGDVTIVDEDVTETVVLELEPEPAYTLTFNVQGEEGTPIENAVVTLDDTVYEPGGYMFEDLLAGTYSYIVSKEGYLDETGQVEIVDEDVTLTVVLEEKPEPLYTVTFEVQDAEGAPIEDAEITFDGQTLDAGVYIITEVAAGTWDYTVNCEGYFDATGQVVVVDEDVEHLVVLEHDDVSVPVLSDSHFTLFPNPATSVLNVQAGNNIKEVRVVDMRGQVVYSSSTTGSKYQVNVSNFEKGMYILQVQTAKGVHNQVFEVITP